MAVWEGGEAKQQGAALPGSCTHMTHMTNDA